MPGAIVTFNTANRRLLVDTSGLSADFTGISPNIDSLRFRKRSDGLTIDVVYADNTQLSIVAMPEFLPNSGTLLPVDTIDGVSMLTQTQLYNVLVTL